MTLIQVLLLLTYWFDKIEDTKSRCYWMRIAWSFANDQGLGHASVLDTLRVEEQRLRRRLWWCCFMRDQLISFSERRASGISVDEASFPPLLAEDFACSISTQTLARTVSGESTSPEVLTQLCLQKVKLCVIIHRVLDTQYELRVHKRIKSTEPTMLFLPRLPATAATAYPVRDSELQQWYVDLNAKRQTLSESDSRLNFSVVAVHQAMLEMLYWTVVGMVHRPGLSIKQPEELSQSPSRERAQHSLRTSAQKITEITRNLEQADMLRFQPPIVVTSLFSAVKQHLKDAASSTVPVRSAAEQYLSQTAHSLRRLQEIWFSADNVANFLESIRGRLAPTDGLTTGQGTVSRFPHQASTTISPSQDLVPEWISQASDGIRRASPGMFSVAAAGNIFEETLEDGCRNGGKDADLDFESLFNFEVFESTDFDMFN